MCSGPVRPYIRSSKARASVRGYLRSDSHLAQFYPLYRSPTSVHRRADLATRSVRVADLDGRLYEVTRPAETCATPRSPSHPLLLAERRLGGFGIVSLITHGLAHHRLTIL